MIFKEIDNKDEEISTLKKLYKQSQSDKQKQLILKDLKALENGYQAEKDNAYYLDFEFKDSKKFVLLHDIRIEHNGLTAQFDHILIGTSGVTALESKSFKGELTINDDTSLTVKYGKFTKTYPSPVEQNKRHLQVLKQFIEDNIELPQRIKLMGGFEYEQKVLIHPNTNVTNETLPKDFVRSDIFASNRVKEINNLSISNLLLKATRIITPSLAKTIANKLILAHKPVKFDYTKKYKIAKEKEIIKEKVEEKEVCEDICPRCKEGKLVKRVRKRKNESSKYKSDEFLGCSRFPKCRYTQELEAIAS